MYSENRRKAEESHAALDKLSAKNELPLYNQPSDTDMYTYNKKRSELKNLPFLQSRVILIFLYFQLYGLQEEVSGIFQKDPSREGAEGQEFAGDLL